MHTSFKVSTQEVWWRDHVHMESAGGGCKVARGRVQSEGQIKMAALHCRTSGENCQTSVIKYLLKKRLVAFKQGFKVWVVLYVNQ
jgi:hypothetical protein